MTLHGDRKEEVEGSSSHSQAAADLRIIPLSMSEILREQQDSETKKFMEDIVKKLDKESESDEDLGNLLKYELPTRVSSEGHTGPKRASGSYFSGEPQFSYLYYKNKTKIKDKGTMAQATAEGAHKQEKTSLSSTRFEAMPTTGSDSDDTQFQTEGSKDAELSGDALILTILSKMAPTAAFKDEGFELGETRRRKQTMKQSTPRCADKIQMKFNF